MYVRRVLNFIWLGMILCSVLVAGWQGTLEPMTKQAIDSGKDAVMALALPLAGAMALWLGMMRLAERAGLIALLARVLRPAMGWLFPDVPKDHPAIGAMVMNMGANILGLGNAASPLGLKAMRELEKINPHPGTATNAMCTFLAINTSSIQLVPFTAISVLAVAGSLNPTAIVGTSILATTVSTIVGITAVKLLEGLPLFRAPAPWGAQHSAPIAVEDEESASEGDSQGAARPLAGWIFPCVMTCFLLLAAFLLVRTAMPELFGFAPDPKATGRGAFISWIGALSVVTVPLLLLGLPLIAAARGVPVYEEFVEGAKEGFEVAVKIIPFLVAMLVAIGMFRASGCIEWITETLRTPLVAIGFPPELLPMSLMRPLSGSGTLTIFQDLVTTHGADSLIARIAGTIYGSTETTFYVIALYFGSVAVRRTRHAIPAGLLADAAGIIASITICRLLF